MGTSGDPGSGHDQAELSSCALSLSTLCQHRDFSSKRVWRGSKGITCTVGPPSRLTSWWGLQQELERGDLGLAGGGGQKGSHPWEEDVVTRDGASRSRCRGPEPEISAGGQRHQRPVHSSHGPGPREPSLAAAETLSAGRAAHRPQRMGARERPSRTRTRFQPEAPSRAKSLQGLTGPQSRDPTCVLPSGGTEPCSPK